MFNELNNWGKCNFVNNSTKQCPERPSFSSWTKEWLGQVCSYTLLPALFVPLYLLFIQLTTNHQNALFSSLYWAMVLISEFGFSYQTKEIKMKLMSEFAWCVKLLSEKMFYPKLVSMWFNSIRDYWIRKML